MYINIIIIYLWDKYQDENICRYENETETSNYSLWVIIFCHRQKEYKIQNCIDSIDKKGAETRNDEYFKNYVVHAENIHFSVFNRYTGMVWL